jgi:hypothetical protein
VYFHLKHFDSPKTIYMKSKRSWAMCECRSVACRALLRSHPTNPGWQIGNYLLDNSATEVRKLLEIY